MIESLLFSMSGFYSIFLAHMMMLPVIMESSADRKTEEPIWTKRKQFDGQQYACPVLLP